MVQRPLFTESRRPEDKSKRAAAGAIKAAEQDLRLTAVAISERGRYALVRKGHDGETVRLTEGAEVDGWTLVEVSPHTVTLRRGEESQTLPLLREVMDEPDTDEEPADQSLEAGDTGGEAETGDETTREPAVAGLPDEPEADTTQPASPEVSSGDASAKGSATRDSAADGDGGATNDGVTAGE
jgi:hypothetical protein